MAQIYPAIPAPSADTKALLASVEALKEAVEMLSDQRDVKGTSAVTWNDLAKLGIVSKDASSVIAYSDVSASASGLAPKITGAAGYLLTSTGASAAWMAPAALAYINIMEHGGDNTGAGNNDTAFTTCWNLLSSRGGGIIFPPGRYKFASQIARTFPNSRFSVAIVGCGDGVTELYWPSASGGMQFTFSSRGLGNNLAFNNITVSGMTFVTGAASGGYGLHLKMSSSSYEDWPIQSIIQNCTFCGSDFGYGTPNNYWTQCNRIEGVSFVKWNNCQFSGRYGSPGNSSAGQGVYLGGPPGGSDYGILYYFSQCLFNFNEKGLVYGQGVQGVSITNCDFNGQSGTAGIWGDNDAGTILAQLFVSNCQFDNGLYGIYLNSTIYNTQLSNCTFTVSKNFGNGVYLAASNLSGVSNCSFQGSGGATNCTGLYVGPPGQISIMGNSFIDMKDGFILASGTSRCFSMHNSFRGLSGVSTQNFGSSPTPGTPHE